MTTIVASFAEKVIASDSKVSDGDIKWKASKIERIGASLFGAAGDCSEIEKFFKWKRGGRRPTKMGDQFVALELNAEGIWYWDKKLEPFPPGAPVHAIGTGAKAALAAVLLGCNAERAVEIACEVDDGSGPPVVILAL